VWAALQQRVDEFLDGITLADLLHEESRVHQELFTIGSSVS
jgi:DNA-binding IscR family transcriptional regulator